MRKNKENIFPMIPSVNEKSFCDTDHIPITKILNIELLAIDLSVCARCVPTGDQLQKAMQFLSPVANALGIELKYNEIVVQSADEAKRHALLTSPTIRINGRDIAQDIRESVCESCGDLTEIMSLSIAVSGTTREMYTLLHRCHCSWNQL